MGTNQSPLEAPPESQLAGDGSTGSLLLQLRSDRRLGHEWDDWDGRPLPEGGVFDAPHTLFFQVLLSLIGASGVACALLLWLVGPRLDTLRGGLDAMLSIAALIAFGLAVAWAVWLYLAVQSGRLWIPRALAERGLVPWVMPKLEWLSPRIGLSRDRVGNASLQVFNRLSAARAEEGVAPGELLVLLPRCLGKEAMRSAMQVAERYGVPMFVAARGRYARQMIALRRPKAIIAVACERDLVSGVHDVAGRLPVLGTTLQLGEGPCRNTTFSVDQLEEQVRRMLGLDPSARPSREKT